MFNMQIGAAQEAYESPAERKYERWLKRACAILGVSMEECDEDTLLGMYEAGATPEEGAAEVVAEQEAEAQAAADVAAEARAERCLSPGYGT